MSVGTFETPAGREVTLINWTAHPEEKPTFAARARNSARRLGLFTLTKPHIFKTEGVWCRTRCLDLNDLGLNDQAMAHVDRLREGERCPV